MHYREFSPSPELQPIVECFWFLTGQQTRGWELVLPDGRAEIIFQYGVSFARRDATGRTAIQPPALFVGQLTRPLALAARGSVGVAAIRLRPAATALFGCAASEMTDRFEPLDSLTAVGSTLDQLSTAKTDQCRINCLERWLIPRVSLAPRPDVDAAVASLARRSGMVSIASLELETGLTRRHLERLFLKHVGVSPKMLARLFRMSRAARLMLDDRQLADVATACGYSDQSHMSNDFRHLVEQTPQSWQLDAGDLGPLFLGH